MKIAFLVVFAIIYNWRGPVFLSGELIPSFLTVCRVFVILEFRKMVFGVGKFFASDDDMIFVGYNLEAVIFDVIQLDAEFAGVVALSHVHLVLHVRRDFGDDCEFRT